jgi:hypothetical protein
MMPTPEGDQDHIPELEKMTDELRQNHDLIGENQKLIE